MKGKEDPKARRIVFTPELDGRPNVRALIGKALEKANGSAALAAAFDTTLKQRENVINSFGSVHYETTLEGISKEVTLPDWLYAVEAGKEGA